MHVVMQVGANGSVAAVVRTAPSLFVFCLLQIGVHLAIILGLGKLFGFTRRDVLLASNANVGGTSCRGLHCCLTYTVAGSATVMS